MLKMLMISGYMYCRQDAVIASPGVFAELILLSALS